MMTILIINDLSESKTLDKEALRSVRGGNFYCGDIPVNIEEILGKHLDPLPNYPMPHTPYEPAGPLPSQPIPFGGPGPADEFV
jgi:hypothetical protein